MRTEHPRHHARRPVHLRVVVDNGRRIDGLPRSEKTGEILRLLLAGMVWRG